MIIGGRIMISGNLVTRGNFWQVTMKPFIHGAFRDGNLVTSSFINKYKKNSSIYSLYIEYGPQKPGYQVTGPTIALKALIHKALGGYMFFRLAGYVTCIPGNRATPRSSAAASPQPQPRFLVTGKGHRHGH